MMHQRSRLAKAFARSISIKALAPPIALKSYDTKIIGTSEFATIRQTVVPMALIELLHK
jgi:hypothetical protein